MPCDCSHMEPRFHETESKNVAGHLVYLLGKLGYKVSKDIRDASTDIYGNESKVHEWTELLCTTCGNLSKFATEKYIYDAHNPKARALADWWENHQAEDKKKKKKKSLPF